MTMLLLLLAVILVVGIAAALTMRGLLRATGVMPQAEMEALASGRSALESYQPMGRLFAPEDFAFVEAQPGASPVMLKQLRRQRARVMRLYLHDLRGDFARLYAFCRLLAPQSQDPRFAALITQQALSFYGLWMILQVRCSVGWFLHVRVDTVDLVGSLERLRAAARAVAVSMTPQSPLAAGAGAAY
jgi:hypothetical protein